MFGKNQKAGKGNAARIFKSGASRNSDVGKLDYDGFLSPLSLHALAEYMNFHRALEDGSTRDSDNWQKGIPEDAYRKSCWRHFMDWWAALRGFALSKDPLVFLAAGILFNVNGWLHEYVKRNPGCVEEAVLEMRKRRGY